MAREGGAASLQDGDKEGDHVESVCAAADDQLVAPILR